MKVEARHHPVVPLTERLDQGVGALLKRLPCEHVDAKVMLLLLALDANKALLEGIVPVNLLSRMLIAEYPYCFLGLQSLHDGLIDTWLLRVFLVLAFTV